MGDIAPNTPVLVGVEQPAVVPARWCRKIPRQMWSVEPGPGPWAFADVTEQVGRHTELCELVSAYCWDGIVAGYTLLYLTCQMESARLPIPRTKP